MSALSFLIHFVARPAVTGAIAASSAALAEVITEAANVRRAGVVVELGTGTGVFTEKVLQKLPPKANYLGLEIDPDFVRQTRSRCPSAVVHLDSAVNAKANLARVGFAQCDSIVCGLPWAGFRESLQDQLFGAILEILEPGGVFVTFAYWHGVLLPAGRRFYRKLQAHFQTVERTRTVWYNLPPAFVYRAVR